jgi:endoglucanase
MKTILASVALAILTIIPLQAVPGRISVKGNQFVNADGKPVVFRGIATSDASKLHKSGVWNQRYFEAAKAWGANIIRFPIHPQSWRKLGEKQYLRLLDEGVAMAKACDLHVIIDWHSIGNLHGKAFFKGGDGYPTTSYDTTMEETFAFWRIIARRYGKDETVAFFELFNEPAIGQGMGECSWEDWRTMMEKLIAEIRAEGAKTVPLVAGFDFGYDLKPAATSPIRAEGIGYVSHPYPGKIDNPAEWEERWTRDWGFMSEKYPVILTEIGFQFAHEPGGYDPINGTEQYVDAITNYCAARGISYTVWCFDPHWVPKLISDWDFTPTESGEFFRKAMLKELPQSAATKIENPPAIADQD